MRRSIAILLFILSANTINATKFSIKKIIQKLKKATSKQKIKKRKRRPGGIIKIDDKGKILIE